MKEAELGKTSGQLLNIVEEVTDELISKNVAYPEMSMIGAMLQQNATIQLMMQALDRLGLEEVSANNIEATYTKMEYETDKKLKDM